MRNDSFWVSPTFRKLVIVSAISLVLLSLWYGYRAVVDLIRSSQAEERHEPATLPCA